MIMARSGNCNDKSLDSGARAGVAHPGAPPDFEREQLVRVELVRAVCAAKRTIGGRVVRDD